MKWENTAHITKMGIEGTVALASLAAAITTILIATKVIAGPTSLALIASPAGIAVLFIAAVYFAAQAYSSYQQMYKNEEISEAKTGAETAAQKAETAKNGVEGKVQDLATKTELADKADKTELADKLDSSRFNETLKSSLEESTVVQAFIDKGFQKQ
ncbi:hypothetical protein [Wolbachia endosymbiont (group A) of Pogonocherus hispidulus]|uniref:hypothetical protein n=1 Tax=Wolbachia endosymbiont (group A) of Pogonocherus hispidulus TaxID=3066136 RepID=UPI003340EDF6